MSQIFAHRSVGTASQFTLISRVMGFGLALALIGCTAPKQQAGSLVTHLVRLVAARKIADQSGAERWKSNVDPQACLALLRDNDEFDSYAMQYCHRGGADLALGLGGEPCISADLLQGVFHHYGWTFNREYHTIMEHGDIEPGPIIDGHMTAVMVSRPVPVFAVIGELSGTGSLKFEFRQQGEDCATDVVATQLF